MTQTFDTIVIGAGAMGSAASYYLSKQGQKVLLLEQFEIDHQNGSSYGSSRIIRYSYDYPEYVELAKDNYPLWFAVEDELGEKLIVNTGGIDFGLPDHEMFKHMMNSMQDSGLDYEMLSLDEAHKRFPQFRFDDSFKVMYQPDSGLVRASASVKGHIQLAEKRGATVKANCPVASINVHENSVEVITADETFSAGRLVVTAGSWAEYLCDQTGISLPLTPLRCQLNFLIPDNIDEQYSAENCPIWIAHIPTASYTNVYGIPSHHKSGFKIAFHGGQPIDDPSEVNRIPDDNNVDDLRQFMKNYIPDVADAPLRESRICLYTNTPDEHFIVDKHPEHSHVVIGAGFSGHGFKFSTIIGKMLTDIALTGETPHNDSLFKISRFLD